MTFQLKGVTTSGAVQNVGSNPCNDLSAEGCYDVKRVRYINDIILQ